MRPSLVPPNFALVERGVYRSSYPASVGQVAYLRQHVGVRTIAVLSAELLPPPILKAMTNPLVGAPATATTVSVQATLSPAGSGLVAGTQGTVWPTAGAVVTPTTTSAPSAAAAAVGDAPTAPPTPSAASAGVVVGAPAAAVGASPSFLVPAVLHLGQLYSNSSANRGGGGLASASWAAMDALSGEFVAAAVVEHALDLVFDATQHPVVLMCPTGDLETAVVVGCTRRYSFWSLAAIFAECHVFATAWRVGVSTQVEAWPVEEYAVGEDALSVRKHQRHAAGRVTSTGDDERVDSFDDDRLDSGAVESVAGGTPPLGARSHSAGWGSGVTSPDAADVPACRAVWPLWYARCVAMQDGDRRAMLAAGHGEAASTAHLRPSQPARGEPHEVFRWTKNPPALDPRSSYSGADSIVEEDDD